MKKTTRSCKRLLSLIMALAMILTLLPTAVFAAETPATLYLKPNANWTQANARFAAYFFDNNAETNEWVDMTDSDGDGVYEVTVPEANYPNVIFCRMNPNNTSNSWDTKWNQTADLTVPTDGTNCYTVAEGAWDKGEGSWSTYPPATPETPDDDTEDDTAETITVYFRNDWLWPEVYVHYWNDNDSSVGTAWPGEKMTKVGTDSNYDVYSAEIPAGATGLLFNGIENGKTGEDNRQQTPNVTGFTDGSAYYIHWDGANAVSSFDYTPSTGEGDTSDPSEPVEATTDYYLVGYINGANYGCEEDSANLGEYKFVDGKLTATFTKDSYVFIKTGDNANWYMTQAYTQDTTATFCNTTTGATEKMLVPGNVKVTFTLVDNGDGTLTLSYTTESGDDTGDDTTTEATYIVAGTAGLCGTAWDTANTANKMTLGEDGLYTITYESVPVGTHSFKVTDGTWDNSWGGTGENGNYDITLEAVSNVTITFNAETKAITVTTEATGEVQETVSYKATLHFANTLDWSTVNLYTWTADGTKRTGDWPGTPVQMGTDGYYTGTVTYEYIEGKGLNFIFNNGSAQTVDLTLAADAFTKSEDGAYTAEKWVALTTQTDGKYNAAIVDSPEAIVTSPVVSGNSVTFNYGDNAAQAVSVAGSFNENWGTTPMTKNEAGVWTVTIDNLAAGDYQYKFVVDDIWILDPMNSNVVTEADGNQNSAFYILSSGDEKDSNKVTINVHYTREDGNYENWNLWVWGSALSGHQVDFAEELVDGAKVATIELEDARAHTSVSFKERKSVDGNNWADEGEKDRTIDLSTIVSGTIDYYIPSGSCEYGEDVVRKNKVSSVELNYDTDVITITTTQQIANPAEEITLVKGEGENETPVDAVVNASGAKCILSLKDDAAWDLATLYQYRIEYQGFTYDISVDAVYASDKFAEEFTYEGNDLGATYTSGSTTFKVWAPTAETVSVNLYTSGTKDTDDLIKAVEMARGEKGVWSATVQGNLNGTYYTYAVTVDGETVEAVDPYARTTGVNGNRGMVINLDSTDPDGWANDTNPNPVTSQTNAIIYELHVRDFSIDDSSGVSEANRGKYLAFTEKGTKTANGATTGIDYLDDLGVTHLHLLPVYDYGSVEETTCENFNWGYDPVNYNTPEGSYSTDPYNGAVRVKEFKQMVKSLHDHDISVVMDVVYNHVYDADKFCFNNIVPGYFSRVDSNRSGCGNDTASEREMVRKYIVESVLYWAEEYHIDGFRFDLVGLLDVETINQIVDEVHKVRSDIIFYGEGWDMDDTNKEPGTEMAKQGNASKTPGFAYFSDSMRNGIGGSNGSSKGFASGQGNGADMVSEWMAKPWWTSNPQQVIQYASCHDNYTLIDKLVLSTGATEITDDIIKMNNLAAAFYMTAQGVPFIHAGEEFLREKLEEDGGRCENSYNAPDSVNRIQWSNLEKEAYAANAEYYKGLIAFRKAHPALSYDTAAEISANVKNGTSSGNLLAFQIDGNGAGDNDDIYVIFNASTTAQTVTLPDGSWTININGTKAGIDSLGTASGSVSVDGISAMVLTKADEGEDIEPVKDVTLYFSNNKDWDKVYAYAWIGDTEYPLGAWPGTEMTYVETNTYGEDIYSITVTNAADGIIFHNNAGTQTTDQTIGMDNTGYYCDEQETDGKWTCGTYVHTSSTIGSADDYFLVGYINGADYTGSNYKFDENGQIKTTFGTDSYVYVINGDSSETYMTDGYLGAVTSGILKDTSKHTLTGEKWDKLLIPGGAEVTITMVKNDDNTITLSYETTTSGVVDNSGVQDGVTLHCWNWSFDAITENMKTIADQGYTAIQTSPIQPLKEATNLTTNSVGSHWWVYYQPVEFVITTDDGNALGTKTDFKEMCAEAEKYGIKVIVDVVANHLGNKEGNDLAEAIPDYLREDEYWHDITTDITDWNDRYNMTQYCLSGLPDLNTANKEIQGYVLDFLKECVDAGADGFRFDMAKSIETPKDDASFASDFWPTVINGVQEYAGNDLYIYGEVLDNPAIAASAYTQYMAITDNSWGNNLRSNIASGTASLAGGYHKAANASNLVIWAESHDTFTTTEANQNSSGVSEANINKTWALVAARADAMGLYLARPESTTQALGVASATGWANSEVKAVNAFHNAFNGQSESIGNENGISYVERGTTGAVLVNTSGTTADVNVSVTANAMENGTYTDQISGKTFTVTDGKISGQIGETGIAVVYNVEEPELFNITSSNIVLGNELAMYFYVQNADLNGEDYVAVVTKSYADGREDVVVEIPYSEWESATNDRMRFKFDGIAAKEMSDNINAVIKIASTGEAASNPYNDSIRGYVERGFANNMITNQELGTMLVDMLNYGAAAQEMFSYGLDDLANKNMTDYQDAYATKEVTCENKQTKGTGYKSMALVLESNISMIMFFDKQYVSQDMTAVVTFTDHYNKLHTMEIPGSAFEDRNNKGWAVIINELVVADGCQLVTCKFKDANGNEVDGVYGIDSMESMCARAIAGGGGSWYEDIMKFSISAYNYFH